MSRASKPCGEPGCPNLAPCPQHTPKPWATSTRRERTRSGWQQQRRARAVMNQHDGVCHVCGKTGADEVDHVVPLSQGGPDTFDNLAPIHSTPCHREKTAREAQEGRTA